jgi:hypothetical protein
MSVVNEIPLPGIGVRYEFVTQDRDRVAVVHPRTARSLLLPLAACGAAPRSRRRSSGAAAGVGSALTE